MMSLISYTRPAADHIPGIGHMAGSISNGGKK